MAYTAIVIKDNHFLSSFTFDAPHDRPAAYARAQDMWSHGDPPRGVNLLEWGDPFARVVAIVPGHHEGWSPFFQMTRG
jgi:hypothetical protein